MKSRNTRPDRRQMGALLGAMVQVTCLLPNNNKNGCLYRTLVEDEVVGFGCVEGTAGEVVDALVWKEMQTFGAALVGCVRQNF